MSLDELAEECGYADARCGRPPYAVGDATLRCFYLCGYLRGLA